MKTAESEASPIFQNGVNSSKKMLFILPGKSLIENDWKWQMRNRIKSPDELLRAMPNLARRGKVWLSGLRRASQLYRMAITPYYLSLINPSDTNDPLARQAIPSGLETLSRPWEKDDPLDEEADSEVVGLTHRYPDRVLMVTTNLCAMYCRHCTRKREWRSPEGHASLSRIEEMIRYIRAHEEIRDVIVSGGDPLILSTHRLEKILQSLRSIPHVEIIRIGTRVPVVMPMRIDDELIEVLDKYGPIWLNTQFNHPDEITEESAKACDRILRAGVPIGNQTVLLRGVNDCPSVMTKLCQSLLRIKVRPYYLYQCDPVKGVGHFRTSVGEGVRIIESMRGHTSGLAIPTFVIDAPQGAGKIPVGPNYVIADCGSEVILRNYEGIILKYDNPPASSHKGCSLCSKNKKGGVSVSTLIHNGRTSLIPAGNQRMMRRENANRNSI